MVVSIFIPIRQHDVQSYTMVRHNIMTYMLSVYSCLPVHSLLFRSKPRQHLDWVKWSYSGGWLSVDRQDGPGEGAAVFVSFLIQLFWVWRLYTNIILYKYNIFMGIKQNLEMLIIAAGSILTHSLLKNLSYVCLEIFMVWLLYSTAVSTDNDRISPACTQVELLFLIVLYRMFYPVIIVQHKKHLKVKGRKWNRNNVPP